MEREKVLFRGALFDFVFAKLITYQRYEYYGAVKTPRLRSITKSGASAFREDCLSTHNNGRNQSRHDPQCYFRKYKRCIAVCADQSLLMNVHNPRIYEIAFYSQFDYQVNILCENMFLTNISRSESLRVSAISVEVCFSEQKYPPCLLSYPNLIPKTEERNESKIRETKK